MTVEIGHIDLQEGDHIFIRLNGSVEHSICVSWKIGDKSPTVSGPLNCKSRKFTVDIHGMVEILEK